MRDIKFRVWDSDNEVIEYFDLFDLDESIEMLYSYRNYFSSSYFKDEENYLMQFSGIKDKNGKDIYEGDILSNGSINLEVTFNNGSFFADAGGKFKIWYLYEIEKKNTFEVIGNIYETPELIKK